MQPSPAVRYGVSVRARTPASSANLGPGFDSMALALELHDEVTVEAYEPAAGEPGVQIEVSGQGKGTVPLSEDHLVVRSLRAGLAHAVAAGAEPGPRPGLRLTCHNAIPHGRGLGSSAAAIAVGLILARGLLRQPETLDDDAVLALATAAEGHPDNASAALFGGCTLSWTEPPAGPPVRARSVSLSVTPRLRAVVCVPDAELATSRARAMLPQLVPHADAAFNAGRAALLVHALTVRPDLLPAATEDRLHQEQRAPAMPATADLLHAVRRRGVAAVVSGAGPSLLVLGEGEAPLVAVREALAEGAGGERGAAGADGSWLVLPLPIDTIGTVLI